MSDDVKRPYRSRRRAESAEQTRDLIRAAAARLFVTQGVSATTMRQVAAEAGVAERTVYTAFPTKAVLFNEVVNIATAGDDLPIAVANRPGFADCLAATDPRRAAELAVDFGTAVLERAGDLIMAAIESSGADADMREFCDRGAANHQANMLALAQAWERNGLLRDHLDATAAGALLHTLGSPHVHHLLRRQQDWPAERYRDWFIDTLLATVLKG
ncbi:TetR/AcrR family transcriptional regulator [Kutzneria kofuensis]|uniref:AcrR family transcriptional regulator n=1 Tax=Kutzneria kofuensis TaxID=103725 RepID=A0A7W9NJW4_9PSEU|nr:TetR/AcrR family transcriptional regulator [Kutzneria kofuensis]MBB5894756.1 AcrR family transcriptional regulator [Kutzneria kofuensis]